MAGTCSWAGAEQTDFSEDDGNGHQIFDAHFVELDLELPRLPLCLERTAHRRRRRGRVSRLRRGHERPSASWNGAPQCRQLAACSLRRNELARRVDRSFGRSASRPIGP